MLILLLGSGTSVVYQVMTLEDRLDEVTRTVDQVDGKVKWAQYEKAKLFAMAKDVLLLAPKDPNAEQIVVEFKLRQLQAAQPGLMDLTSPSTPATTDATLAQPNAVTNSASKLPSETTNTAPVLPAGPTPK